MTSPSHVLEEENDKDIDYMDLEVDLREMENNSDLEWLISSYQYKMKHSPEKMSHLLSPDIYQGLSPGTSFLKMGTSNEHANIAL